MLNPVDISSVLPWVGIIGHPFLPGLFYFPGFSDIALFTVLAFPSPPPLCLPLCVPGGSGVI